MGGLLTTTRHVGAGRVHGCAWLLAWMLWIPAAVSGQELPDDRPPEAEVASEASFPAAVSVEEVTSPHAPSGSATSPPARRGLRLWAHAPGVEGLSLLVRPGRTGEAWRLVCELPCEVRPMPGAWDIAVIPRGGEHPLPVAERTVDLYADGSLELRYSSREWIRIVGAVALCLGLAGVVGSASALILEHGGGEADPLGHTLVQVVAGLGLAISGFLTLAGMGLLAFTPIARVRWVP
jgi:hypothetical protein